MRRRYGSQFVRGHQAVHTDVVRYGEPTVTSIIGDQTFQLRREVLRPIGGGEAMIRLVLEYRTIARGLETTISYVSVPRQGARVDMDSLELAATIGEEERRLLGYLHNMQRKHGARALPEH